MRAEGHRSPWRWPRPEASPTTGRQRAGHPGCRDLVAHLQREQMAGLGGRPGCGGSPSAGKPPGNHRCGTGWGDARWPLGWQVAAEACGQEERMPGPAGRARREQGTSERWPGRRRSVGGWRRREQALSPTPWRTEAEGLLSATLRNVGAAQPPRGLRAPRASLLPPRPSSAVERQSLSLSCTRHALGSGVRP